MKKMLALVATLVFLAGTGAEIGAQERNASQGQKKAQSESQRIQDMDVSPEEREVLQASERLRQAVLARDADQLRDIIAINYQMTDSLGRRVDKFDAVDIVAFQASEIDTMDVDTLNVEVDGDDAMQRGMTYIRGNVRGSIFTNTYHFIRTWQRENGQWKLTSTRIMGGMF